MRRLRKWLLVLGSLVLVLAAGIVLTWVFFGPAIAKNIITGKLRGMGIEESAFEVDRMSLHQIDVSGIAFGPDTWLKVESATATYGTFDLLFGKLETLTLDRVRWTIRADEEGIAWGFPAQPEDTAGPRVPDLPFDEITIANGIISLEREDETQEFAITGRIGRDEATRLGFQLTIIEGGADSELKAKGVIRGPGPGEVEASAAIAFEGAPPLLLRELLPAEWNLVEPTDLKVGGAIAATFTGDDDGGIASRITTEALKVRAAAASLEVETGGVMIEKPAISIALSGVLVLPAAAPAQLSLSILQGAAASADSVRASDLHLQPVRATIEGADARPLLAIKFTEDGAMWEAAVTVAGKELLLIESPAARGHVPSFTLALDGAAGAGINASAIVDDGELELPEQELYFAGLDLRMPLHIAALRDSAEHPLSTFEPASIAFDSVRWRDRLFEGGGGFATFSRGRVIGDLRWLPFEEADIDVHITAALAGDSPRATILFTAPPFEIKDDSAAARLITGSPDWKLSGIFALDAMLGFGAGAADAHLLLSVENGSISRSDEKIALSGIDGSLEIDRFLSLITPGVQRVTVEGGTLGSLTVTGGEVEMEAVGDGMVRFPRFVASMGEYGVFLADPFSIDPTAPVLDTTITARNMSLAPWLDLVTQGRARGEGMLAGRIAVAWDAARPQEFTIRESTLTAQPSQGRLTISEEHDLRKLLEESDPRFQDDEFMNTVGDKIIAAIQDFLFTSLEIEFEEGGSGTEIHIITRGRGRQGEDPQEIGSLTLNIHAPFRVLYWAVMAPQRLRQFFDPPE